MGRGSWLAELEKTNFGFQHLFQGTALNGNWSRTSLGIFFYHGGMMLIFPPKGEGYYVPKLRL
ncbi:hypothetical protein D082_05560 [Synechocystis sp. PCC 6714]|nr:hypothetical protein D082_05560 [Synechocystis sp. PCC 6714]